MLGAQSQFCVPMKTSEKSGKLLSSIREHTSLFDAFGSGATPDDIKQGVIESLSPYFTNETILDKMAVNVLMGDAIEFVRISQNQVIFELFEYGLQVHQQARARDLDECLGACTGWLPVIYEGLSIYWSQLHLELDKDTLDPDEFVHECLRNIGSVIEGSMKPVVRELLHQERIIRDRRPTLQEIDTLSLGDVIDELMRLSTNPSLFAPLGVRVSQWRNIAQHFSARIEDDEIICRYGRSGSEREIRLTRSELMAVAKHMYDMFASLRLANRLFFLDNLGEILARGLLPSHIKIRPEMNILNFVAGLASQGFEVIDFQHDDTRAMACIRDVSTLDPNERRFHTVQFAGVLWHYTQAPVVTIEYYEQDGTPNFRTRAGRELLERIEREDLPSSTLAEEAELTDLKANQPIPRILKNEK